MFTGLVVEMGEVLSLLKKPSGAMLTLRTPSLSAGSSIGDSIAINGACLTVVRCEGRELSFDLSAETLDATNLGRLRPGERVNLEPSLRADGKLGGHFVTGHVDAVGTIRSKNALGDTFRIEISAPALVIGFLVEKGSVAVDGISLTVVDVAEDYFSIVIIPHTASVTTIGIKGPGDSVNLEADIIGKYVARFLKPGKADVQDRDTRLLDALAKSGFLT